MASGQMMDMAAVDATLDMDAVVQLQQLKTGAMIGWCVDAGAALGAADADQRAALTHYAQCVSVAFQIADDLLDVEGDEQTVGKRLRKDDDQGKQTLVRMLGRESARNYASGLVDRAVSSLSSFGPAADLLRSIAHFSINRDR
jgi:farnesyl diphosphate synthase